LPAWGCGDNRLGEQGGIEQGVVLEIVHKQGKSDAECRGYCNANPFCKMWMATSKKDCYLYRDGKPVQEYINISWHNGQRRGWKCGGDHEPAPIGGTGCGGKIGRPDWMSGVSVRHGVKTDEECAKTCQRQYDCKFWVRQRPGFPGNTALQVCWTMAGASLSNIRQPKAIQDRHLYGWRCQAGPPADSASGRRLERLSELEGSSNNELEAPPSRTFSALLI